MFRQNLSTVIKNAVNDHSVGRLQNNTLAVMGSLKESKIVDLMKQGTVFELNFVNGELNLNEYDEKAGLVLLPPPHVVNQMLDLE